MPAVSCQVTGSTMLMLASSELSTKMGVGPWVCGGGVTRATGAAGAAVAEGTEGAAGTAAAWADAACACTAADVAEAPPADLDPGRDATASQASAPPPTTKATAALKRPTERRFTKHHLLRICAV